MWEKLLWGKFILHNGDKVVFESRIITLVLVGILFVLMIALVEVWLDKRQQNDFRRRNDQWLMEKAAKEDGQCVSVGGLVTDVEKKADAGNCAD